MEKIIQEGITGKCFNFIFILIYTKILNQKFQLMRVAPNVLTVT